MMSHMNIENCMTCIRISCDIMIIVSIDNQFSLPVGAKSRPGGIRNGVASSTAAAGARNWAGGLAVRGQRGVGKTLVQAGWVGTLEKTGLVQGEKGGAIWHLEVRPQGYQRITKGYIRICMI